ncbi:phospholipase A2 inhibitor and Ly6/PLAUR domain-containing protein-like [Xenopus laevis]|uniref:Phospholipase A2 inhibitor and Ly6/PLAUR domain-containing protein-like n=1 Tax=Xenopus laevis TaxID=8355 RepID=A0A8J1L646_XENLA|nr:phospholipase A2 inhibitor and Ly6/PLAUR domain-containing protein-like [Xenopus laevis]
MSSVQNPVVSMLFQICMLYILSGKGAYSLSCTLCIIEGSIECVGESVSCPQGLICSTSSTEITRFDGLIYYNVRKYCGDPGRCDRMAHSTYTNYKSLEVITCCDTENCTGPVPTWPKYNTEPNGLTCPTCAYPGFDCLAKDTIQCIGKEEKCFTQTEYHQGLWQGNVQTMRGCSTESHCKFGNWSMRRQDFSIESRITCSFPNSGNSQSFSFFLIGLCLVLIHIYLEQK